MLAWQSQSIDYKLRLEKPASPQTPDVAVAYFKVVVKNMNETIFVYIHFRFG